jgi:hypothetical protein
MRRIAVLGGDSAQRQDNIAEENPELPKTSSRVPSDHSRVSDFTKNHGLFEVPI